ENIKSRANCAGSASEKLFCILFNGFTERGGTPAEHHRVADATNPTTGGQRKPATCRPVFP
ncbi:hypothetical protein, partial [Mesorhizobium mediterraneum]|uniref:hypothetical protein n=1 Tax=Mesorhizobium mediterraneum TaxID=43617 RepID=UPI001AED9648